MVEKGYTYAVGKRKTAVAQIRLYSDAGPIVVDDKLIEDALKERQSGKPAIPYTTYETPESLLPDFEEEDEDSADEVSAGSDTDTQNAAVLKFN